MTIVKRGAALCMALLIAFVFCACGDAASGAADSSEPAMVALPAGSTPAVSVSEEEPFDWAAYNQTREFLTGLERGPGYPEGKRITAVMVNNHHTALPHNGLSEAKVLVEIKVEGGITRFMAIFDDYETMPSKVGSLRSARDQFFQLLLPFWGFYVHEGPANDTHPVNLLMNEYDYKGFDIKATYGALYTKDSSRGTSSYNWYDVSGESITKHIQARELDDERHYSSPMFNFVPYTDAPVVPADGSAVDIAVRHSSGYITYFNYDSATSLYNMSQWVGSTTVKTIDNNNGQQLGFTNVVVIFAPMTLYNNSPLVKVDYAGGVGYYISNGGYEMINWTKGGPQEALQLYSRETGEPVWVNCGKTYLTVVDDEELESFHNIITSNSGSNVTGSNTGGDADAED